MGLSPYTRGNQKVDFTGNHPTGSIPVHTGKPFARLWDRVNSQVYPRTHGETTVTHRETEAHQGLSPYTRGNLMWVMGAKVMWGSIPVHTGKPPSAGFYDPTFWVYPRTHGETHLAPSR